MVASKRSFLRSSRFWALALLLSVAIHVDWHLARPGHHSGLSFGLPYHWLLALPLFAGLWLLARRHWANELAKVLPIVLVLGVLLGQGLEPFAEMITSPPHQPFQSAERWRAFVEFMLAGLATLGVLAFMNRRPRPGS